jgi:ABC-type transport system involved in cytochrome c biogenesis permease component
MAQDPSSPLPPADEKVGSVPLGARFFDLAERYIYVAVATLLLVAAVATIGHALFSAIEQTRSGVGLLIPIFALLNDLVRNEAATL